MRGWGFMRGLLSILIRIMRCCGMSVWRLGCFFRIFFFWLFFWFWVLRSWGFILVKFGVLSGSDLWRFVLIFNLLLEELFV